jgi:hypothetical protein
MRPTGRVIGRFSPRFSAATVKRAQWAGCALAPCRWVDAALVFSTTATALAWFRAGNLDGPAQAGGSTLPA